MSRLTAASAEPDPDRFNGLFSSATDEWPTPQSVFAPLNREFPFTLDPCATPQNASLVGEAAVAAESLQRQAQTLVRAAQVFRVN